MNVDKRCMELAITLALKAEGKTSPNPLVGAVVVKNGVIVGKGYHEACGLPHAEVNALKDAGKKAKGAVLYVTLEPCDHFGRTPPCTEAIIKSGIRKVIIAMKDPNPITNGRGIKKLKRHHIDVVTGILEKEARSINKPFVKYITKNIPYVTVKMAQSLDGKIATRTGDSKWISSESSRKYVHELRGKVDAVMVGAGTALKDDPLLLSKTSRKQPTRIIVDSRLSMPLHAKIFSSSSSSLIIIATTTDASKKKIALYESKGIRIMVTKAKYGMVDLAVIMKLLGKMGMTHILVEGGGTLVASLLEKRLVDRLLFFIAPKIVGGKDAVTSVEGKGVGKMSDALILKNITTRRFEDDILIMADL